MARSFHRYASKRATSAATTPSENNDFGVAGECAYQALKDIQSQIGLARIRLGAILCALEDSGAWEGRTAAKTFRRFVADEGIEPKAAVQYMKVARVFVFYLCLSAKDLRRISAASMRTLVEAAKVADESNRDEVLMIVTTLPRPEAIEALRELAGTASESTCRVAAPTLPVSRPVNRILDAFGDLTFTERSTLFTMLKIENAQPASARPAQ